MRNFRVNRFSWQAKGLEAWWPTNHGSKFPGIWPDQANQRYPATFPGGTNDPVWEVNSVTGGAYKFDGLNDYFNVNSLDTMEVGDFTWSFWYKGIELTGDPPSDDQVIFSNHVSAGNQVSVKISDNAGNVGCVSLILNSPAGLVDVFYSQDSVLDQEWHHCVVTRTPGTVRIYIDGEYNYDSGSSDPDAHSTFAISANEAYIGDEPGNTEQLEGWLADLRYYTRVLSDVEVRQLCDPKTRWDLYWTRPTPPSLAAAAVLASASQLAYASGQLGVNDIDVWNERGRYRVKNGY